MHTLPRVTRRIARWALPALPASRLGARVTVARDAVVIALVMSNLRRERPDVFSAVLEYVGPRFDDLVSHFDAAAERGRRAR